MSKEIRELARKLIKKSNQEGMLFSELVAILREEKEKLKEERTERHIARTAEEELFRKKAKAFLEEAKSNPISKTKFHTRNFMEKYLEILCVYFSYRNLCNNNVELRAVVADRLRIKPASIITYERKLKEIALAYISTDGIYKLENGIIISKLVDYIIKSE